MRIRNLSTAALGAAALFALGAIASPAEAQTPKRCDTNWKSPIVCDIELVASVRGESARSQVRDTVRLRPGAVTILSIRPTDQFGNGFPAERFAYRLVPGRACSGLVDIQEERTGEVRITPGSRAGSCELAILPANNTNLDLTVDLQIGAAAAPAPTPAPSQSLGESGVLAGWLYQALLGRTPEPEGRQATADAIRAGRLNEQVDLILSSVEFQNRRRGMSATQLLDSIYQGLLGRSPDPAGTRRYLGQVTQGQIAPVVKDILKSDELRQRLAQANVR